MKLSIKAILKKLRDTPNWQKEDWGGEWKNIVVRYDRTPFEAADALEAMQAENAKLRKRIKDNAP